MRTITIDSYIQQLKHYGVRVTPQRQVIIKVLMQLKHPTAEQILEELSGEYTNISFATVYNTLRSLKEIGLAREIRCGEGCTRFELVNDTHYHLVCDHCGNIEDVYFEPQIDFPSIEKQTGFAQAYHNIEIHGSCKACTMPSST